VEEVGAAEMDPRAARPKSKVVVVVENILVCFKRQAKAVIVLNGMSCKILIPLPRTVRSSGPIQLFSTPQSSVLYCTVPNSIPNL